MQKSPTDKLDREANFICERLVKEFTFADTWHQMNLIAEALRDVRIRHKNMREEQIHLSGEGRASVTTQYANIFE